MARSGYMEISVSARSFQARGREASVRRGAHLYLKHLVRRSAQARSLGDLHALRKIGRQTGARA